MACSSKMNKEGRGMGLRDKRADAFCVHMVEVDDHRCNCKRSLYRTVLGVPKLSGCNDKTSKD